MSTILYLLVAQSSIVDPYVLKRLSLVALVLYHL